MGSEMKVTDALRDMANDLHEGSTDEVTLRYAADYIIRLEERIKNAESVIDNGIPKEDQLIECMRLLREALGRCGAWGGTQADWDEFKFAVQRVLGGQ